jgi:hypothetical protein
MRIRDFRPVDCLPDCAKPHEHGHCDVSRIHELFTQQRFSYPEPEWEKLAGKVSVDQAGIVRIFELVRPTVETYSGIDAGDWQTPGMKAEAFKSLDRAVVFELRHLGYDDQFCWIAPACRSFARRLIKMCAWFRVEGEWIPLVRWLQ